ncbi:phospholipase A1 member A-like [Erpetoichthys calabaricus]|uniref:phospholipase A1 member A-like n=1 Tax=Erpetoichthys calabaricus TaxID=27687 RepID=UPI0010A0B6E5|nr:phospholipase A1 member A-like [Erpetoichthys calabaricus]
MSRTLLLLFVFCGSLSESHLRCVDFQNVTPESLQIHIIGFSSTDPHCTVRVNASDVLTGHQWDPHLPTVIIIHGRRPPFVRPRWVGVMARELLAAHHINILVVDWLAPRRQNLVTVASRAGAQLARTLSAMQEEGASMASLHLIGFGTGAHIAGSAGAHLQGDVGRITGLDPFRPSFRHTGAGQRLDYTDAQFVDIVHTNFKANEPVAALGTRQPMGHVDFYVGKGHRLPGCPRGLHAREHFVLCDHQMSHSLFTHSIRAHCPLLAFPCHSLDAFWRGRCVDCQVSGLGTCPQLGYNTTWLPKARPLPFYKLQSFLGFSQQPSHCVAYFLLTVETGGDHRLRGYPLVKLVGRQVQTSVLLLSNSPVTFVPGKQYQFLVAADTEGTFRMLLLEVYTGRLVLQPWRKRWLWIDWLILTRLPKDRGTVYSAYGVAVTEGTTQRIQLRRDGGQSD